MLIKWIQTANGICLFFCYLMIIYQFFFLFVLQFVVTMFWALYLYDRDLVYPRLLDNFIPQWLNHGMVSGQLLFFHPFFSRKYKTVNIIHSQTRTKEKAHFVFYNVLTSDVKMAVVVQSLISVSWNKSSKVGSKSGRSCFYDRWVFWTEVWLHYYLVCNFRSK